MPEANKAKLPVDLRECATRVQGGAAMHRSFRPSVTAVFFVAGLAIGPALAQTPKPGGILKAGANPRGRQGYAAGR